MKRRRLIHLAPVVSPNENHQALLAGLQIVLPTECDLENLRKYLGQPEVTIGVDLGIGKAAARVWGCDLTEGYIKENAYYTT